LTSINGLPSDSGVKWMDLLFTGTRTFAFTGMTDEKIGFVVQCSPAMVNIL